MIVIGLTGSIAMGKSTAAKMLVDMRGVVVHDSDAAVHRLYNDPEVIDRVREFFPKSYDSKTGKIDKLKLREELGTDHEKWDTIEDILHPYVRASQQQFLQEQQRLGTRLVILDIPLLFETGAEERVDYTICVSAPEYIQRQRVLQGRGMDEEDFEFRLSRQMPDDEKKRRADFVVQTGVGLAETRKMLHNIIQRLTEKHYGTGVQKKAKSNENRGVPPYDL